MANTVAHTNPLDKVDHLEKLMPNESIVNEEHEHVVLPQHRHHFETQEQQREAGSFGMWLFLLTENFVEIPIMDHEAYDYEWLANKTKKEVTTVG